MFVGRHQGSILVIENGKVIQNILTGSIGFVSLLIDSYGYIIDIIRSSNAAFNII
jgi:hypothetical protein